jgi:hypothetical protein
MSLLRLTSTIGEAIKTIEEIKNKSLAYSSGILDAIKIILQYIPDEAKDCRIEEILNDMKDLAKLSSAYLATETTMSITPPHISLERDLEKYKDLEDTIYKVLRDLAEFINENCIIPEKRKGIPPPPA